MNTSSTQSFEIDNHFQNLDQSKVNKSKKRLVVLFVVFLLIAINAIIYYKSMGKTITQLNSEVKAAGTKSFECESQGAKLGGMAAPSAKCQTLNRKTQDMIVVDYGVKLCSGVKENPKLFQNEVDCNPERTYWWTNPYNECDKKCQPLPGFYMSSDAGGGRGMQRPDGAWYVAMDAPEMAQELDWFPNACPIGYSSINMFTWGTDLLNTNNGNYDCHLIKGWYYNCDSQATGCHDSFWGGDATYDFGKFWRGTYANQPAATPCVAGRTTIMVNAGHSEDNFNSIYIANGNVFYGLRKYNSNRVCHLDNGYYGSSSHAMSKGVRYNGSTPYPYNYYRGHWEMNYPTDADVQTGSNGFTLPTACPSGSYSEGHNHEDHLWNFRLSSTGCSASIPTPLANQNCGKYKSRLTSTYPCTLGAETGPSCGVALQSLAPSTGCRVMGGYYGLLTSATSYRCPTNKTTLNFMSSNTTSSNCTTRVANNATLVYNDGSSTSNVFSNMSVWADRIASRTVNKGSRNMFDDTCSSNTAGVISCVRGTMWSNSSWVRNSSFATLWANIDWSGIAVMTTQFYIMQNDFGHGVGSTLIGGNVYFSALHYIPSNLDSIFFGRRYPTYDANWAPNPIAMDEKYRCRIVFLDINSVLKMYSVRPEDTTPVQTFPLRMFAPEPWYSDVAFQLLDVSVPVSNTISTFPVPRLGTDIANNISNASNCVGKSLWKHCLVYTQPSAYTLNYASTYGTTAYTAYTGVTYDGRWNTATTAGVFNTATDKMNGVTAAVPTGTRVAVAPFNVTPVSANIPVFQWNSLKQLKLSWTTYQSLVRPIPSWDFWYGDQMRGDIYSNNMFGPGGEDTRSIITVVSKLNPGGCTTYCTGKYNLARGDRNGDSGSPAFIIVSGKPLLIGGLHMGSFVYATKIRDAESDEEGLAQTVCAATPVQPCGLKLVSGISAITAYWANFEAGMTGTISTSTGSGWGIAKALYQASFCGFTNTNTCPKPVAISSDQA